MITKEDFDKMKRFDRITDSGGYTNGFRWVVSGVTVMPDGMKVVILTCTFDAKKPNKYACKWSEESNCMVDAGTEEVVSDFSGEFAYVHEESVSQVVEEMLADKQLSKDQANRFLAASRNDISLAIHSA